MSRYMNGEKLYMYGIYYVLFEVVPGRSFRG